MKKRSKHAVGECYKTLNIHDPHEQYVWADAEPTWLKVLQVLGVIAGAVSMFTLLWLFTVIVFLL
jgi:hypothetical protein